MPVFAHKPPEYTPGYVAFPTGIPPNPLEQEACLFRERLEKYRAKVKQEQEELERAKATKTAADEAWERAEEGRRARLQKIKEEGLRGELEWMRLGGKIRNDDDAELRKTLDEEAKLTDEERSYFRAWEEYEKNWERLALSIRPVKSFIFRKISFSFSEIPWPILRGNNTALGLNDLTGHAIAAFLLHPLKEPRKSRKEKLREAMLHYHPDKFGRFMHRVVPEDERRVQDGVGIVTKCLTDLMNAEH
ncbi:hypothetical protein BU17DRAFT_40488 [Hysterangium stoloniferum]|nr:hypothetical protein BU17DRAFT_40488 [Hysterangium stoloniferum]